MQPAKPERKGVRNRSDIMSERFLTPFSFRPLRSPGPMPGRDVVQPGATDRVASGSQLLEQFAGLGAAVGWRAFQIREALFQDRRSLWVGLANLLDDLLKRRGFTAHGHALGVVVQNHLGPLQATLRLDLDRRGFPAAAKPEK